MKRIFLKSITLEQFQGYGNSSNKIILDNPGVIRLFGDNGAGKSSMMVGLETCLFNNNYKNISLVSLANTNINRGYKITTEFISDKIPYKVVNCREFGYRNNTNITVTREDTGEDLSAHTITDTLKIIEEIVGVDYKTLNSLISMTSDNLNPILYGTDAEAREFLTKIFSLDKYDEFYKKIIEKLGIVEKELVVLKESGVAEKAVLSLLKKQVAELVIPKVQATARLKNRLESLREKSNETIHQIASLESELSSLDKQLCSGPMGTKKMVQIKLEDLEEAKKSLHEADVINPDNDRLQLLIKNNSILEKEVNSINEVLESKHTNCPFCKQNFSREDLFNKLQDLRSVFTVNSVELLKLKEADYNERMLSSTESLISDCVSTLGKWSYAESKKEELNKLVSELGEIPEEIDALEKELNSRIYSNRSRNEKLAVKGELTKKISVSEKELTKLRDEYEKVNSKKETLQKLKEIYSPKGVKSFKIEQILLEINRKLNDPEGILAKISNNELSAKIVPIRNSQKGRTLEQISVIVSDSQKELPFAAFSEGEKKQVALALMFIIHELSPIKFNVLMLDEVTSNLSIEKRERLFDILSSSQYNNDTVFVVSHDDLENENLFTDVYKFMKIGGFCTVEEK